MSYRNKTYICFDADTDMHYYNLMKAGRKMKKLISIFIMLMN